MTEQLEHEGFKTELEGEENLLKGDIFPTEQYERVFRTHDAATDYIKVFKIENCNLRKATKNDTGEIVYVVMYNEPGAR